jgi:putative flippase GtrA
MLSSIDPPDWRVRLERVLTPARLALAAQFLRFGIVGTAGFVVDTCVVYATRGALGLYGAGVVAYLFSVATTWALNRAWTFRGLSNTAAHRQFVQFAVACLFGFVLNRGTYFILVTVSPLCAAQPVFAVAAGAFAGMFVNFGLARAFVFR